MTKIWLLQSACTPAFLLAHLQVKIAFDGVVDVDQGFDMRPAQLSPHCGDKVGVGKDFSKTQHVAQVFSGKTASVVGF
jgi:hypothetical protein